MKLLNKHSLLWWNVYLVCLFKYHLEILPRPINTSFLYCIKCLEWKIAKWHYNIIVYCHLLLCCILLFSRVWNYNIISCFVHHCCYVPSLTFVSSLYLKTTFSVCLTSIYDDVEIGFTFSLFHDQWWIAIQKLSSYICIFIMFWLFKLEYV